MTDTSIVTAVRSRLADLKGELDFLERLLAAEDVTVPAMLVCRVALAADKAAVELSTMSAALADAVRVQRGGGT